MFFRATLFAVHELVQRPLMGFIHKPTAYGVSQKSFVLGGAVPSNRIDSEPPAVGWIYGVWFPASKLLRVRLGPRYEQGN